MTYTLELVIPDLPKRINEGHGASWRTRYGEAKKWERYILHAMINSKQKAPDFPLKKAKLTLTRRSSRVPDYNGLVYTFKVVEDALVKLGVIEDDNMNVIGIPEYKHEKVCMKDRSIKIKVEEVA